MLPALQEILFTDTTAKQAQVRFHFVCNPDLFVTLSAWSRQNLPKDGKKESVQFDGTQQAVRCLFPTIET